MKPLRERWKAGEATLGAWCTIPSPWTAEVASRSGHDWVCVDTQHGLIGYDVMLPMLQAISAGGAPSFVRVPWNEPGTIMKALDAGAGGVIVPMVNSADEAKSAVGACRYAPDGFRSMGPIRARTLGGEWRSPICVVMVETVLAVSRVDEILAVIGQVRGHQAVHRVRLVQGAQLDEERDQVGQLDRNPAGNLVQRERLAAPEIAQHEHEPAVVGRQLPE